MSKHPMKNPKSRKAPDAQYIFLELNLIYNKFTNFRLEKCQPPSTNKNHAHSTQLSQFQTSARTQTAYYPCALAAWTCTQSSTVNRAHMANSKSIPDNYHSICQVVNEISYNMDSSIKQLYSLL